MTGYLVGMAIVIVGASVAFLFNHNIAWIVSYGGTLIVQALTMMYVVFIDSRKRWPGVPAWARFSRVITFYRD